MPTYEYGCENGHHFELFQRISDKPRGKCPTCGAKATRKISGGAGLVFKGSGFYITDYGKDGKGPRKAETGGSDESGRAAEGAGDAKATTAGEAGEKAGAEKPKAESKPEKQKLPKPFGKKRQ